MLIRFVSAYQPIAARAADAPCLRRLTGAVEPMQLCVFFPQITTEFFCTDKTRKDDRNSPPTEIISLCTWLLFIAGLCLKKPEERKPAGRLPTVALAFFRPSFRRTKKNRSWNIDPLQNGEAVYMLQACGPEKFIRQAVRKAE